MRVGEGSDSKFCMRGTYGRVLSIYKFVSPLYCVKLYYKGFRDGARLHFEGGGAV